MLFIIQIFFYDCTGIPHFTVLHRSCIFLQIEGKSLHQQKHYDLLVGETRFIVAVQNRTHNIREPTIPAVCLCLSRTADPWLRSSWDPSLRVRWVEVTMTWESWCEVLWYRYETVSILYVQRLLYSLELWNLTVMFAAQGKSCQPWMPTLQVPHYQTWVFHDRTPNSRVLQFFLSSHTVILLWTLSPLTGILFSLPCMINSASTHLNLSLEIASSRTSSKMPETPMKNY